MDRGSAGSFQFSKAERRRLRHRAVERLLKRRVELRDYLLAQVETGEMIVAQGRDQLVTNRRILFAWRLDLPPHAGEWTHDAISFDEVTRWSVGRDHDERPLIRLEHPRHGRIEWVPAHRFLMFRWRSTECEVERTNTCLQFLRSRAPTFVMICDRLRATNAQQGEPFAISLPGTREEGMRGSIYEFRSVRHPRLFHLRHQAREFENSLYRGGVAWRVRISSWLIFAVPAWFITPWLVAPAIVLAEAVWIAGLQWSWHRARRGRAALRERA